MPNKGRRVAARQGQIASKKKRNRSMIPTSTERPQESTNLSSEEPRLVREPSASTQHTTQETVNIKRETFSYTRSEIRRILIIGSFITAILIILSVVLE